MKAIALLMFFAQTALAQTALSQTALIQSAPDPAGQSTAPLPPGLLDARLLPGWVTPQGHRMIALQLTLEPGWKTYWRSPGDAGVPPRFDWDGSRNLGTVTMHWPRPEAIESGGERTLGYHDLLVLPVEITPADPDKPVDLQAVVDFGLCDNICVPAQVELTAPGPDHAPDPRIEAALAQLPRISPEHPTCHVAQIADGMRVTAVFDDTTAPEVAMEMADSTIWVSQPELTQQNGKLRAEADFIDASGAPFALDPTQLRLTLISPDDAVEYQGCDVQGWTPD